MFYFKTIFFIGIAVAFLFSGIFIQYSGIHYENVLFIIVPVLYMFVIYNLFDLTATKPIDFNLYTHKLNFPLSLMLLTLAVAFSLLNLRIDDLLQLNFADIRSEYIERDITVSEQMVPLLMIYPFVHFTYLVSNKVSLTNLKIIALFLGLIIIALTTGGRQILFQIFVLTLLIKGRQIFTKIYFIAFVFIFVLIASLVTVGRNDHTDISKAGFLENISPVEVQPFLKEESSFPKLQEVALETTYYFGHQVPAFCNKINNLHFSFFPEYMWGMQPFLERQFSKMGILNYSQQERFDRLLDLSDGSDFFRVSWSTGFLDIYFNLGIFGSFLFFSFTGWLLYNCSKNEADESGDKHRILRAYNILFIITMFMTPLFFDTTIIFSYIFIFFGNLQIKQPDDSNF